MRDLLTEAKARLPLSRLMADLGHGDRAKKSARCPFHDDSSASFSLYVGDDGHERWRCFSACGGGDAVDYLAKARGLSNADACREFIRLAGVTDAAPPSRFKPAQPPPASSPPFDWPACVAALTPVHAQKLAEWRGYSPEFVTWLHGQGLVGLFDVERICFPVQDAAGAVVACHYRRKEDGSWRFHPTGTRTAPLVVGDLAQAQTVLVFESQWDLLAVADKLDWHRQPPDATAAVATRGASNARLLAGRCRPDATVFAFVQNDAAGQRWLADLAAGCGCNCAHVVTPEPHKDANDWTRAGATRADLEAALAAAQSVPVAIVDLHAPRVRVSKAPVLLPEDEPDPDEAAEPFPVECLPPPLAGIVLAVARAERVPPALPAVCALGLASAAVGAGLEVVSAEGRPTRANLYLLASAESGSGKSQVFRRIAEPIVAHQHQLHEGFREKTAPKLASEIGLLTREIKRVETKAAKTDDTSERERMLGELEYKRARLAELERENAPPAILCGDVTSEKLAVLLAANRETLFSASPEARQIVDIVCGRYSSIKSTDEAIYLSGWSGDQLRVDRLGRDPITLRKPCLSALWLLQPDAMARLFESDTFHQSGFLPRFLACHTKAAPRKIVQGEAEGVGEATHAQWADLVATLLRSYHAAEQPFSILPSPEAKRRLDDFFNAVVDRRAEDLADVGGFAARYAEQAWRVALTLHAALYAGEAHLHPLDDETAEHAITIVRWFIEAQLSVLAKSRHAAAEKIEAEILDLLESNRERRGLDFITAREVYRARIVPEAGAAAALLARMESCGILRGEDARRAEGGRPTRIFRAVSGKSPVPG